jgi:hypothetical protein
MSSQALRRHTLFLIGKPAWVRLEGRKQEMIGVVETAAATVSLIAPFMPYLIAAGKAGGKKLTETIAAKGGEAAWDKAQALWGKIKEKFGDAPDVQGAANVVASNPEDETYQQVLAKTLSARLQKDPDFAQELLDLLGGQEAVQRVLADSGSWVEGVKQQMDGSGEQIVHATERSVIKGVEQTRKK